MTSVVQTLLIMNGTLFLLELYAGSQLMNTLALKQVWLILHIWTTCFLVFCCCFTGVDTPLATSRTDIEEEINGIRLIEENVTRHVVGSRF